MRFLRCLLSAAALSCAAANVAAASPMLDDFEYPYPVKRFAFTSQQQPLSMAYMDVAPEGQPNGRTVVAMHGKNFCAATWESAIRALAKAGYRVIAPDQIGFCKSSKPQAYQFGLHQLAANTNALLKSLGIDKAIIMGHSMGGMLAFRYTLMYPEATEALVTVNPLGLEDWKAEGVPVTTVDELYAGEQKTTAQSIKAYQLDTYYAGVWKPEYDRWVDMQASMYQGEGKQAVAWDQALTSDMVFMQPVVYELPEIKVPTLMLIGALDNTAIGKNRATDAVKKRIGNYKELAPKIAAQIPGASLVMFPDLGHSPQVSAPDRFNDALIAGLAKALPPK
ncbi:MULTISPECIES: alpha/beta hydrolase [Rhodomicrobium]|uniref:alpha/beta fold hydrolase n=1 Tax=Rhodomicrobium TaxID=1068 RepID=UPI000B4BE7A9|nr:MULTISPECIES: alpha/beta hydrolase [Rhodomicrobium]